MSKVKQIASGLWQGAFEHVIEEGIPAGVTHVLLMLDVKGVPLPHNRSITFTCIPIPDDPNGLPNDVLAKLQAVASGHSHESVLTVCHMGENRSGLMSALILYERQYSGRGAVAAVQAHGPINSDKAPHALWNPGFVRQLRALDEH